MKSDLEIAQAANLLHIDRIAEQMGLDPDRDLVHYGKHIAKVSLDTIERLQSRPNAKYVVVTALTPTPLGEGKSTMTVGIGQAMKHIGKRSIVTVRQPSQGPTFGIKGGAAGGGHSQIVPMESFNLHLTGDIHAITAAHNLQAAMLDNHLHQGNELNIVPHQVMWQRVVDLNDRALRNVIVGLGAKQDGVPRQTGFDISVASELMACLALTTSLHDLRERLGRIVVAYDEGRKPVTAEDLKSAGAATVLLRDAIMPNLMQTLENTPALVHCGPFANIAHGNSSVLADLIAIKCTDYLFTEAGFGADIGAEKFFNIKCRYSGLRPNAAIVVVTTRALKAHTGKYRIVPGRPLDPGLLEENVADIEQGSANMVRHIQNLRKFGINPIVAVNHFADDTQKELDAVRRIAVEAGAVGAAVARHWAEGGRGAAEVAELVVDACERPNDFEFLYPLEWPIKKKIEKIATEMYGAGSVTYSQQANRQIRMFERDGFGDLPICVAKTHLSFTADPKVKGAPSGFELPIREVRASVGAGFVYPIAGNMRTMPGLPSSPAAERVDIDENGRVVGLF